MEKMPDFLKPPQECQDHAMWSKHLMIAHWLFLGFGIFFGLFTDSPLVGLVFLLVAMAIYFWASHLEVKHIKWHAKQEKEKRNM